MDLEARVQHYSLCSSEVASEVLAARQSNQFLPQSARALLPKATLASRLVVWPHHSALRAACFCRGHLLPTGQPLLDCSPTHCLVPTFRPAAHAFAPYYAVDALFVRQDAPPAQ